MRTWRLPILDGPHCGEMIDVPDEGGRPPNRFRKQYHVQDDTFRTAVYELEERACDLPNGFLRLYLYSYRPAQ